METIILASKSPRRKELLSQIGVDYICEPARGEEIITTHDPALAVEQLSRQKAQEVSQKHPNRIILAADTVVAVNGKILGKPADEEDAKEMLRSIQGNSHSVFTGVTIVTPEEEITFHEETKVWVYPMSREEIDAYVATGEPMDKAGAYGIQGAFAAYIKGIVGDYNNVVGLPVGSVWQKLKKIKKLLDN
jgi:septum formation protein